MHKPIPYSEEHVYALDLYFHAFDSNFGFLLRTVCKTTPEESLENASILAKNLEIYLNDESNQVDNYREDGSADTRDSQCIEEETCEKVYDDEEDLSEKEHDDRATLSFDPQEEIM